VGRLNLGRLVKR